MLSLMFLELSASCSKLHPHSLFHFETSMEYQSRVWCWFQVSCWFALTEWLILVLIMGCVFVVVLLHTTRKKPIKYLLSHSLIFSTVRFVCKRSKQTNPKKEILIVSNFWIKGIVFTFRILQQNNQQKIESVNMNQICLHLKLHCFAQYWLLLTFSFCKFRIPSLL